VVVGGRGGGCAGGVVGVGFGVVSVRTAVVVGTWLAKADVLNVVLFGVVVLADVVSRSVVVIRASSVVGDATVLGSGRLVAFGRTVWSWRTGAVGVSQNAVYAAATTAPKTAPVATRLCPLLLLPNTAPP
jgi:hypothetical protein